MKDDSYYEHMYMVQACNGTWHQLLFTINTHVDVLKPIATNILLAIPVHSIMSKVVYICLPDLDWVYVAMFPNVVECD